VRDTIARQSDVDASSVKLDIEPGTGKYRNGTITFAAKAGKSVDLQTLLESLKKTRLGAGTRSGVNFLQITAEGDLVIAGNQMRLKVSGTNQEYSLGADPKAKVEEGAKPAYERLQEAVSKGQKIASVTGRIEGWNGKWPEVLPKLLEPPDKEKPDQASAKKPALLMVTDFQTVKK
jgi:hypothetical protein